MAIPTLTDDITVIADCESLSGSAWGVDSTKWVLETDIYLENATSIALPAKNTGDGGYGFSVSAIDFTANLFFAWVWTISPTFYNTIGNNGIYVRFCTSTSSWTTDYVDYFVGGSDVAWVGAGWHLIVVDINNTADRATTSPATTKTNINRVGVGNNNTAASLKTAIFCLDQVAYGNYVEVTTPSHTDGTNGIDFNENGAGPDTIVRNDGGSWVTDGFETGDLIRIENATDNGLYTLVGSVTASTLTLAAGSFTTDNLADTDAVVSAYCDLEDIYQKDGPTDDIWTGIISKNRDGAYEVNYSLILGDQSGALDCHFVSQGDIITFTDQHVSSSVLKIQSAEDTGTTRILFGDSSGTGDNRVGFGGSVINKDNRWFGSPTGGPSRTTVDLDANITLCEIYGTTFLGIDGSISFDATASTPHIVTNVTFDDCVMVTLGEVEARNLTFTGYEGTDGALSWNNSIDIKNSSFLANANSAGTAHGIYHGTAGTFTYDYLLFAGNDYDIENASAGLVTINASNLANPSTYENTNGGTTVINNTKTLTITAYDQDNDPVESAQVWIQKDPNGNKSSDYGHYGNPFTSAATNSQGDLDFVVTTGQTVPSDLPSAGWIIVHDVTTGKQHNYRYASISSQTFTLRTKVGAFSTTAGSTTTVIKDTARDVTGLDIVEGDAIRNESGGGWATVLSVDDTDTITTTTISSGTWSGGNYSVHSLVVAYQDATDTATVPLMNEETNASGVATESYNYGTSTDIIVRVRRSSATEPQYLPISTRQQIGANGLDLTLTLVEDTIR